MYPIEIKKSYNPGKQAIKNFGVVKKLGLKTEKIVLDKNLRLFFSINSNSNKIVNIKYIKYSIS